MGPLAQIFSTAEGVKRKLVDALRNPRDAAAQFVGNQADRARNLQGMTAAATDEFVNTGSLRGPAQSRLDQVVADAYNPMGMVVYHGSPHKFTKFDSSKIGTGEGAQAYGHGLYLAESPDVAKQYAAGVSGVDGPANVAYKAIGAGVDPIDTLRMIYPGMPKQWYESAVNQAQKIQGSLYKVDLPDEQISNMVQWDKPLGQQSAIVKDAINRVGRAPEPYGLDRVADDMRMVEMQKLFQSPEGVEALRQLGVPGVQYLDQASRAGGVGTRNFVVFPGNEDMLQILERNGQPLGLMGVK